MLQTCRLCLSDRTELELILDEQNEVTDLGTWVEQLVSMQLLAVPGAPRGLCTECLSSLKTWESFREQCVVNSELVLQLFASPKTPPEQLDTADDHRLQSTTIEYTTGEDEPTVEEATRESDEPADETEPMFFIEMLELDVAKGLPEMDPPKKKLCHICNKRFSRLDQHRLCHQEVKRLFCDYCSKGFIQHSNLMKHIRTHTKQKPHVCLECGKAFNNSTELKVHCRMHTNERPFPCELCDKAFRTSGHRARHMRSHTGDKPYGCNICGAHFTNSSHLARHQRIHTRAARYGCDDCEQTHEEAEGFPEHQKCGRNDNPRNE